MRFATEAEAVERSQHFGGAGWNGLIDSRVVDSNDPVNARWTEKGIADKDGNLPPPPPEPTPKEIQAEAELLNARWEALLERMDASLKRGHR